jgi:hypothetical protein
LSGPGAGRGCAGHRADAGVSALVVFGIGLGIATLSLAAGLGLLLRPLADVLEELCGTHQRGDCWTAVSAVSWVAGSLLLGLLGFWWGQVHPAVVAGNDKAGMAALIWSGAALVRWTLVGMLAGVGVITGMVWQSAAHAACRQRWLE